MWIYNPNFSAQDAAQSCNGSQNVDTFFQDNGCTNYYKSYGGLTLDSAQHFDDPRFHFDMTYSLYEVGSVFFRGATDTLVTPNGSATYHPMDEIRNDLSAHNCSGGAYDLTEVSTYTAASGTGKTILPGGCVASPTSYTWVPIGGGATLKQDQIYRLAVEATTFNPNNDPNPTCAAFQCGWGRHSYAIAVCAGTSPPVGGTCPSGGLISAWNNMDCARGLHSEIVRRAYGEPLPLRPR